MTEEEWLACSDPTPMLDFLWGKASDRKLRLFITKYCRHNWHLFHEERCRKAIEVAERSADGQVGDEELLQVYIEMCRIRTETLHAADGDEWQSARVTPASFIADSCRRAVRPRITPRVIGIAAENLALASENLALASVVGEGTSSESLREAEGQVQVDFLRDIFGPLPFRPVPLAPAWLTPAVLNLAQAAYDNRLLPSGLLDDTGLAILADALEEAGCTDADILSHLRGPGPHVRGCWPVDLILGKE